MIECRITKSPNETRQMFDEAMSKGDVVKSTKGICPYPYIEYSNGTRVVFVLESLYPIWRQGREYIKDGKIWRGWQKIGRVE